MAAPKGNQYAKGLTTNGRPEKYTQEWLIEEAKALRQWIDNDNNFFLKGFSYQRGYDPTRIHEFVKKSEDFSSAYDYAKHKQTERFLTNGLKRTWDPGFTKYAMARVCGDEWKNSWDREEDKSEGPTTVIINKIGK
jgi:hypothetical protein